MIRMAAVAFFSAIFGGVAVLTAIVKWTKLFKRSEVFVFGALTAASGTVVAMIIAVQVMWP